MDTKSSTENIRKSRLTDLFKANEQTPAYIEARKYAKDEEMNILITGESGTGKEVLAKHIHKNSPRADKPFIIANMSALNEGTLQSDLFGHTKGSFTGAIENKLGYMREANNGTIFLDEIGDISPSTQVALLRCIEYGEIQTLGKSKPDVVDVRVVAATNANLHDKMAKKLFREDLYYRLAGGELHLEPLRKKPLYERKESLSKLISDTAIYKNKSKIELTDSAWDLFLNYEFPGNYREARNIIERMYVEDKSIIEFHDIKKLITKRNSNLQSNKEIRVDIISDISTNRIMKPYTLEEHKAIIIFETNKKYNGNNKLTAKELNINPDTVAKYLIEYKSLGKIPDTDGNNPINDRNNSSSNFQTQ